jgi:hypothetical protein
MKLHEITSPQSLIVVALTKLLAMGEKINLEVYASNEINDATPRNYQMLIGSMAEGLVYQVNIGGDGSKGNAHLVYIRYAPDGDMARNNSLVFFVDQVDDVLALAEDGVWKLTNETF